ncbi:hypothetical protein [Nitrospirillum amazonense]|uniref:hypothetical protein n=1 Tax=Nitrospirillum amazonense TaxID=28077 RepID=UPI00119E1260|nr:hypothetical protein [Nitrospirillum amazonense]
MSRDEEDKAVRVSGVNLFRATAAAIFLLLALILNSTPAIACDGLQDATAASPSSDQFSPAYQISPAVAVPDVTARVDIGAQLGSAQLGSMDGMPATFGRAGHCPCCASHCCCGPNGFISPASARLPLRLASSLRWIEAPPSRGDLAGAPNERPPRHM